MAYILILLAFTMFIIYDYNQIMNNYKFLRPLFFLGALIMVGVTLFVFINADTGFSFGYAFTIIFYALAFVSLIMLVYTLFFAIPFEDAYIKGSKQKLCTKGIYSLCRHPGVLFLSNFYLLLSLGKGSYQLIYLWILVTLCNLVYVTIQDKYTFPVLFEDYSKYKEKTPFVFPKIKNREETQK